MVPQENKDIDFVELVAKRIRKIRLEKGITQEQIFFDTGIHIGRIETKAYNLRIDTIKKICRYLDISLSDFFEGI